MVPWHEFVAADPELAATGESLLCQYGVGLAFLATVRQDGGPRLHPVCPVLSQGRLYVLIIPTSPKWQDLLRDGRYALQTFPQPKPDSAEFYLTGRADLIEDVSLRWAVLHDAKHKAHERESLFELKVERVMHTTWEGWGTADLLRSAFPKRSCNCWGLMSRAEARFQEMNVGDLVLIAPWIGAHGGGIHQLGLVKAQCPVRCYEASRVLWPNIDDPHRLYPFLFFFDTEVGSRSWFHFLEDLGYDPKFNPRGYFLRLDTSRFALLGRGRGVA
jgi:hypothetical protein